MKRVFIISILILILDQLLKIWVKTSMYLLEERALIGVFKLKFIENNGMAFGWELPGEYGKILLTLLRLFALFIILWQIYRYQKNSIMMQVAFALVFAGAMGNIIDSVFYDYWFSPSTYNSISQWGAGNNTFFHGKVVDMFWIDIQWPEGTPFGLAYKNILPPIFNIADISITIGTIIILTYFIRRSGILSRKKNTEIENV